LEEGKRSMATDKSERDHNWRLYESSKVVEAEVEIIERRRARVRERRGGCASEAMTRTTLVGLALSGGGIRSAATNLGTLQGLSKAGRLELVDYLSTVSGGGYIGACLASLLSRKADAGPIPGASGHSGCQGAGKVDNCPAAYSFSDTGREQAAFTTAWESFPFRDAMDSQESRDGLTGRDQMEHIRDRANYLLPHTRLSSSGVLKALGSITVTTLTAFGWFIALTLLVTSIYMWVVAHVSPELYDSATVEPGPTCHPSACLEEDGTIRVVSDDAKEGLSGWSGRAAEAWRTVRTVGSRPFVKLIYLDPWPWPLLLFAIVFGFALVCLCLLRISRLGDVHEAERERGVFLPASGLIMIALFVALCWAFFHANYHNGAGLALPALVAAGGLLGSAMWLLIATVASGAGESSRWNRTCRSTANITAGLFLYALIGTSILAVLPAFMLAAKALWILAFQAVFVPGLRAWLGWNGGAGGEISSARRRLSDKAQKMALDLAATALPILAVVSVGSFLVEYSLDCQWPALCPGGASTLLTVAGVSVLLLFVVFSFVNMNKVSPHYFYRDRLVEAFSGRKGVSPRK
jgi:hypothetical protein